MESGEHFILFEIIHERRELDDFLVSDPIATCGFKIEDKEIPRV